MSEPEGAEEPTSSEPPEWLVAPTKRTPEPSDRAEVTLIYRGTRTAYRRGEVTAKHCRMLREQVGISQQQLHAVALRDLDGYIFAAYLWFAGLQHGSTKTFDQVEAEIKGQPIVKDDNGVESGDYTIRYYLPDQGIDDGDPGEDEDPDSPEA